MFRIAVWIAIPVILFLLPVPAGLSPAAWQLFAVYFAAILGLILRPFSEAVVLLAVIATSSVLLKNTAVVLSGYANPTVWLVFTAFLISAAIIETGLGRRIAYLLIGRFGRSTLGLGYVFAVTDLALAPVTPSNTARSGGIVFPIVRSLAVSLGSPPGPDGRKVGAYLTVLLYSISVTTGYMFLTAIAPNLITAKFGQDILKIDASWATWGAGAAVPGLICLAILPNLVYRLYPPELTTFDNKTLSQEGLAQLGPMSAKEQRLLVLFVLAIVGWATGNFTGIDAAAVALAFAALALVTRVVSWDTLVGLKSAWSTLMWYGGIVGLADGLARARFFDWLAELVRLHLDLSGLNQIAVMGGLLLLSLALRYLFASQAAFCSTMVPVFFTIAMAGHLPLYPFFFLIAFATCYSTALTQYGGALGPVLFGEGYVGQWMWWFIGGMQVLMSFAVHMTIGLPYWKLIGFW